MAGECLQTRWTSSLLSSGTDLRGPRRLRLTTTKLLVDSSSCCRRQIGRLKYSSGRNARPCKLASKLVVAVAGAAEEEEDTLMDEEEKQQKNKNKKVVVVGAGWAGLGAAHHLTKQVGLLCSSQCRRVLLLLLLRILSLAPAIISLKVFSDSKDPLQQAQILCGE